MRVMSPGEAKGLVLTSREERWCEEHQDLPEARAVLKFARIKREGKFEAEHEEFAIGALQALRKLLPPEPLKFEQVYAYVCYNPMTRVEGIPGIIVGNVPTLLFGADLARIREMLPMARQTQRAMPHPMRLAHYRFDRVIPDHKIQYLRSENLKTKTAEEVFAYIGPAPNGNETILGYRDDKGLARMMAHANADEIVAMRGRAAMIKGTGQALELRRFVKDGYVEDPEFDLRAEPRPETLKNAMNL